MEKGSRTKRAFSVLLLILCNAVLIVSVVFYAIRYSREVHDAKEASTLDGFCNSEDALRKISEMYAPALRLSVIAPAVNGVSVKAVPVITLTSCGIA